jgi:hypothetical protein
VYLPPFAAAVAAGVAAVMPAFALITEYHRNSTRSFATGLQMTGLLIGASAAGAILIFFGGFAILPGLAVLGAGLVANIVVPKELKNLRQARSQAESAWRSIQDAWTKQPGEAASACCKYPLIG